MFTCVIGHRIRHSMQALASLPSSAKLHQLPSLDSLRAAPAVTTRRRCPNLKLNRQFPFSLHTIHCQKHPDHGVNGGDTDDMFDDLFKKHGKVVYRSTDQKSPISEADDDAESLSCKSHLILLFFEPVIQLSHLCEIVFYLKCVDDLSMTQTNTTSSVAVTLAKVANDVKAADIRVLFVKPLVYWTRFFIIVTAFSRPQIDAIGSRIRDTAEKQFDKIASGDTKPNSWTLLDFGKSVALTDLMSRDVLKAHIGWYGSLLAVHSRVEHEVVGGMHYDEILGGASLDYAETESEGYKRGSDVVVHIFLPQQRAFYNLEEFYGNATSIELPFDNQSPFRN
ncbi:hypothetical protein ZIOFF_052498 [Zingiber officinale]|uniref:Protein Iojap, chloroplastic n=1 Tax=Zingiber officinale TaxID=94328 RepID=A0A8J5FUP1_ZINOF|nr:hypothetical protein ZIOFF_052498 [Zingiber officinale]